MSEKTIVINIPAVEEWTMKDLKYVCKHNKIKGYTKMSREQLVESVKRILKQTKSQEEFEWNEICVSCDATINTEKDLYVTGESLGEYWCENCASTGSDER